ncbi:MAG: hypothetical protein WBI44_04620 [Syntrophaceticus sp.]
MRHFIVSASIFVLIAAAVIAWQLGIFGTEYQNMETPLTEQQKKPIYHIEDPNNPNNTEEKTAEELKIQEQAVLQEEIEGRYTARLLTTAQDYEKQLIDLANSAWEEYTETQQEGKTLSRQQVFAYIKKGQRLKTKCDNEIYTILQEFESELRANSLPLDKANLCRQEYERKKSERKQEFLSILSQHKDEAKALYSQ